MNKYIIIVKPEYTGWTCFSFKTKREAVKYYQKMSGINQLKIIKLFENGILTKITRKSNYIKI